jgi:hypothetical protein
LLAFLVMLILIRLTIAGVTAAAQPEGVYRLVVSTVEAIFILAVVHFTNTRNARRRPKLLPDFP